MVTDFPISFHLEDGTAVVVNYLDGESYAFHLTRLNSEKHNFIWKKNEDAIEESYETRFDRWQNEAVHLFKKMVGS